MDVGGLHTDVEQWLEADGSINYRQICNRVAEAKGRQLFRDERRCINDAINGFTQRQRCELARAERVIDATASGGSASRFVVLTAFTSDPYYAEIGHFCSGINRAYCDRHGYIFREEVMSFDQMMCDIAPRKFGSYHKIILLLRLLACSSFLADNNVRSAPTRRSARPSSDRRRMAEPHPAGIRDR